MSTLLGQGPLKQIPWYCETDALALATAWQTQLTGAGLPVPRILRTTTGGAWFEIAESRFTLTEYVPGRRYTGTPADRAQAGRTMALLHAAKADVPDGPTENAFDGAINHIALARDVTDVPNAVLDMMEYEVHAWALRADAADWGSLTRQLTHGDTNPWNLIYAAGGPATLIDFDNAHRGPSLRDLAEALLSFCSVHYQHDSTNFAAILPGRINRGLAADILNAYTSVRRLAPAESACLPLAGGAVAVGLVCLGLMRGDFPRHMAGDLANWATAVPADITSLLGGLQR
ncbi:phosphotransferase [Streptomyces sp. NPDC093109]|uniref:phosphotransferase n=1 Tax=Streptomyces sp. NPDC093109 TaxID=3154977 RepID=UPI00345004B6